MNEIILEQLLTNPDQEVREIVKFLIEFGTKFDGWDDLSPYLPNALGEDTHSSEYKELNVWKDDCAIFLIKQRRRVASETKLPYKISDNEQQFWRVTIRLPEHEHLCVASGPPLPTYSVQANAQDVIKYIQDIFHKRSLGVFKND